MSAIAGDGLCPNRIFVDTERRGTGHRDVADRARDRPSVNDTLRLRVPREQRVERRDEMAPGVVGYERTLFWREGSSAPRKPSPMKQRTD